MLNNSLPEELFCEHLGKAIESLTQNKYPAWIAGYASKFVFLYLKTEGLLKQKCFFNYF